MNPVCEVCDILQVWYFYTASLLFDSGTPLFDPTFILPHVLFSNLKKFPKSQFKIELNYLLKDIIIKIIFVVIWSKGNFCLENHFKFQVEGELENEKEEIEEIEEIEEMEEMEEMEEIDETDELEEKEEEKFPPPRTIWWGLWLQGPWLA